MTVVYPFAILKEYHHIKKKKKERNKMVKEYCAAVLSQSVVCPTLCDPIDCSSPGFSVHGDSSRQGYWSGLPCPPPGREYYLRIISPSKR